jgi:hypothetical protein
MQNNCHSGMSLPGQKKSFIEKNKTAQALRAHYQVNAQSIEVPYEVSTHQYQYRVEGNTVW